ncbi:MAG TPA: lasso peptide biosynthesis B2 protein [Caldilineaceae bacterium]|nr:lasso peptide biosynthesis B2 protein [Caldilineaceae bacterium]
MAVERSPLLRRLRAFLRLPRAQQGVFLLCVIAFPLLVGGLRLFSLRRCYALLRACSPEATGLPFTDNRSHTARQLTETVERAARYGLVRPTCLPRSLLLWWLLRWNRIPADLCIGGRLAGGVFAGHAWVESAGQVLNDTPAVVDRYPLFSRLNTTR